MTLDASSFTDPDSLITGYEWDFDADGTVDRTTEGPTTDHTYPATGSYAPIVSAKDFRGGAGSATATVEVKGGPTAKVPKKSKNGKVKLTVSCGAPPCDVKGKLELSYNTARKLNRTGLKIAKFKGTTGDDTHTFTLKVPKDVRRAAKEAGIAPLKVRVTAKVTDSAGLETRARQKTKVRL